MTTQELHIQIDQLLQKVSSHWNSNFLPQEKDFYINREITKFIKQRLNPLSNSKRQSMFDTLKRIQDLNSLVETVELDIVNNNNQKEAEYQLPFDFLYYISSEAEVTPICKNKVLPVVSTSTYYKSIKPIGIFNTLTQFSIEIKALDTTLLHGFNNTNLPAGYLPVDALPDYKKLFIVNNALLNDLVNWSARSIKDDTHIEVRYNNLYQTIEFRSKTNFNIEYKINTINQTVVNSSIISTSYQEIKTLPAEIIISDEEFKTPISNSSLSNSKGKRVIGFLRQDKVILSRNPNAVYSTVKLTYIKKPTKVDLLLSINSELPNEILDEVISNLVEQLKAIIASDTYEKYTQENMLIE